MRFYNHQHEFYCGVDLHTRRMYLCILDREGNKRLHRNVRANPHLKWAFSEAALMMLRYSEDAQHFLARKEKKHGKSRALTMLARKIARTVYHMLKRKEAFDAVKFFAS